MLSDLMDRQRIANQTLIAAVAEALPRASPIRKVAQREELAAALEMSRPGIALRVLAQVETDAAKAIGDVRAALREFRPDLFPEKKKEAA